MNTETFNIHHSARENFDSKVSLLVREIIKSPILGDKRECFVPDIHVAGTLTEKEIIGEPELAVSDYRGKTTGRFFIYKNERYGLINEGYHTLTEIAEAIQKLPAFREKLSKDYIEKCIFSWLKDKFTEKETLNGFISFLTSEASESVKPVTVLIPIANTIVEDNFSFCGTTIRNLSKSMIDEMASSRESSLSDEQKANIIMFFEDFRKEYQGYAAVEINLTCEPNYANDLGISIANRITDLLGIYSGATLMPDVKCISKIKGAENLAQFTAIQKTNNGRFTIRSGILDLASTRHWLISRADLEEYTKCGLRTISDIASKEKRTEFETTILNMAYLYSKSALTSDPMEKLVYMLSALESTLLRNESEPIQQNLAERIAIFTARELSERKAIIKNIKHIYGLRSRYLHHGHSSSDLDELSTFFLRVWVFYVNLLANSNRFKNKAHFLDAIDDHKLG